MNKKGAILHWIMLFVLPLALATFLVSNQGFKIEHQVKGKWQSDFLIKNVLEAKKEVLKDKIFVQQQSIKTAAKMALAGGYSKKSSCGQVNKINLWNSDNKWCVPKIQEEFASLLLPIIKTKLKGTTQSDINYSDQLVIVTQKKKTKIIDKNSYTYDSSIVVPIQYSFDEYKDLETKARTLVSSCKNDINLQKCLKKNKESNWEFTDCSKDTFESTNRKVVFCTPSSKRSEIKYKFALHFDANAPSEVSKPIVTKKNSTFTISFTKAQLADSYTIYYTDYLPLEKKSGKASELLIAVPTGAGFTKKQWEIKSITKDTAKCQSTREFQKAFECDGKIEFDIPISALSTQNNLRLFAVTSTLKGKESFITQFVKK